MARMPREPEAFGEQVVRIFHRIFPEREVQMAGPLDLVIQGRHLGLDNVYRMVRADPDRGVEIVEDFLDRLIDGESIEAIPVPLELARSKIMPRIQPATIFQHIDRNQVAHIPFVNDTVVVFVMDLPRMTVSITLEQMIQWGLSLDDMDAISRENLVRYDPGLEIRIVVSSDGGRAAVMSCQDGYDAARLLMSSLHDRLAPELHGDFFVAAPARDMFLAISCDPPRFVDRLQKRIDRDYRRLPYPITRDLFVVTRDGVAGTQAA